MAFRESKSWLLASNGLAVSALGLICMFWKGRLTFLSVALLFVVMALSLGIFAWRTALTLRRHVPDRWSLVLAGAAWIGFALVFVALGFRWIKPEQPESLFVCMSSYFAFSAVCMLGLGLRLNSLRTNIHRMARGALAAGRVT